MSEESTVIESPSPAAESNGKAEALKPKRKPGKGAARGTGKAQKVKGKASQQRLKVVPGKDKPAPRTGKATREKPSKPSRVAKWVELHQVTGQDFRDAATVLKQAADATRLQILTLLSDGEMNVGELCRATGQISQPAVSHHLALLRHSRLAQFRRSGKNSVYSLTDEGRRLADAVRGLIGGG